MLPQEPPSWRPWTFSWLVFAHLAGAGLCFASLPLPGLGLIAISHVSVFWGAAVTGSRLFGPVLTRFVTERREVWLTIDDGPSDDTAGMLDLLDAHAARATFFVVGERARARPELVRAIVERGHQLGNHSDSHPSASFWAAPPGRIRREIDACQASVRDLAGRAPALFRAVTGKNNPFVVPALRRHRLRNVGWNVRGFDTLDGDPDRVVRRMMRRVRPGAILMLHEGCSHGRSCEILGRLLTDLRAQDYRCVIPRPGHVSVDSP